MIDINYETTPDMTKYQTAIIATEIATICNASPREVDDVADCICDIYEYLGFDHIADLLHEVYLRCVSPIDKLNELTLAEYITREVNHRNISNQNQRDGSN